MDLGHGVAGEYKEGKIVFSVEVASLVKPALDHIRSQIETGAIDPIKGTDMDKELLLKVVDFLQAEVSK